MGANRFIEWRAKRIDDPVERLKYLRLATAPHIPAGSGAGRWRPRSWHFAIVAALVGCMFIPAYTRSTRGGPLVALLPQPALAGVQVFANVWLVDKTPEYETYSNGLRIEQRYAVSNLPRSPFPVFGREDVKPAGPEWRSQPVGIVYHTTESHQLPFEAGQTRALKHVAGEVLAWVKKGRAYHFVIDRFGRVFRIVQESDVAFHAGSSIWGDDRNTYVNLNSSFLGVAFETQTQPGEDLPSATAAQIHAARVLTEMLRGKYRISAANCVTHAQVSVNPANMLVGYHTDWAANFPFLQLGLRDNYAVAPASIDTFGFSYDEIFMRATGTRMWEGLILGEEQVRAQAIGQGLSVREYRKILQQRYREILKALKSSGAAKETSDET